MSKRLAVVCSLNDPSTGVRHECSDIYQVSCVVTGPKGHEVGGGHFNNFLALSFIVWNSSARRKLKSSRKSVFTWFRR